MLRLKPILYSRRAHPLIARWLTIPKKERLLNVIRISGVDTTGATDCTSAVQAALDALPSTGGTILFPLGKYKFNITITKPNVHIRGEFCVRPRGGGATTATAFIPNNTSNPLIQVGNNTGYVNGFRLSQVALSGGDAATYGAVGIYFAGGAEECFVSKVMIYNFTTNFKFQGGTTYPCQLIFIDNFVSTPAGDLNNQQSIYAAMPTNYPTSWTTGIYFSNGHFEGPGTSGSLLAVIDGTSISMSDVYADLAAGHGIQLLKTTSGAVTPYIDCSNVSFDHSSSAQVIEVPNDTPSLAAWLKGSASVNGKIKVTVTAWAASHAYSLGDRCLNDSGKIYNCVQAGTSAASGGPTGTASAINDNTVIWAYISSNLTDCFGSMHIPDQSELLNPQACGSLSFVDADRTGYNTNRRIYASGVSTGPLTIENTIGLLKLSASQGMTLVPGSGYNAGVSAASVVFDNQYGVHGRSNKTTATWTATTAYTVGTIVMHDGEHLYKCTMAGTSGSIGPSGTSTGISDGSCVWDYLGSIDESMIAVSSSNYTSIASPSEGGGLILQARNPNGGIQLIAGGGGQWYVDSSANLQAPAAYIELQEISTPGAPSSAKARLYLKDSGGKVALYIRFPTGVEQESRSNPDHDQSSQSAGKNKSIGGRLWNRNRDVIDPSGTGLLVDSDLSQ